MKGKCCRRIILAAFCAVLTGCADNREQPVETAAKAETEAQDMPEISVFDINAGNNRFDDRIAQEIMERTGVKISVVDPTEDPEEKVNLMLAYRDYPDMILISLDTIGRYQSAGALLDLEPYLDRMPHVKEMYGDMLDRLRTRDGELYYLSNWYGTDEDAVSGFLVRYDYMCKLVGRERADSDEPFTQEEFLSLLRLFQEKYPAIDGEPSVPISFCIDLGYEAALNGMYGMKTYYEKDGALYHLARDPNYLSMVLFVNQMYREGLLDKEWVVNRRALFSEKLQSGRVFATACAYWDLSDDIAALKKEAGENATFHAYKVLGNGIGETQTTYSARNSMGWDAIAITQNCKNPEAVVKVMDFLSSEEGQYLMLWGIEGEDWDYVDGVRTPKQELAEAFTKDISQTIRDTAIRRWTWFIKNGTGSDGSPYDMMTKYCPTPEAEIINRRMKTDGWDSSWYAGLEPVSGTEEALMYKNIADIFENAWPKMVNAASEEECREIYGKMLRDMEEEGLGQVETVITQNYQQRLEQWGHKDVQDSSGG